MQVTRRGLFGLLGAVAAGAFVEPARVARVFLGGGKPALDACSALLEWMERTIMELDKPFRPNQLVVTSQEYVVLKNKFKSHVRYSASDAPGGFTTLSYMGVPVVLAPDPRWKKL